MKMWYLAHQLKYRQAVRKIEIRLENTYKINLLNPFYDTGRVDLDKLVSGEIKTPYDLTLQECKNTVENDLQWIRNSDGLLAIIKDHETIGSFMELFYASMILEKPVYIVCSDKSIVNHLWIRALSFKVFKNIKELESYFIENEMIQK